MSAQEDRPESVRTLESAYGPPSQAAFGGAVFHEKLEAGADLEEVARAKYRYFVGELWERYGEEAWMGPWKRVYARPADATHDIVGELRGIRGPEASISVPLILDTAENPDAARAALAAVFDEPGVTELEVFSIGDGGAMSGLLVAGRSSAAGEGTFLVVLMD